MQMAFAGVCVFVHMTSLSGAADCLADQLGMPKEEVSSWTPYPGGAPANVATATSRLGDRTAFVSAIGEDSLGDAFVQLLQGTI
jgi:fructokinase